MKKQSIIRFAVLLLVCCVMLGCAKDNTTTTIYGTVFNSVTHEPIAGAQIEVGFRTGNDIAGYYISSRFMPRKARQIMIAKRSIHGEAKSCR